MLKEDGLFLFTCASTGRKEHGTRRTTPHDSYGTIGNINDMSDYYKNLTEKDLNEVLNLNDLFSVWDTYYCYDSKDLYFLGLKKGSKKYKSLPKYKKKVICTSENIYTQKQLFRKRIVDEKFNNFSLLNKLFSRKKFI